MTVPIPLLSFHDGTVRPESHLAPVSLGDSLANDRLATATQVTLRETEAAAGIVVFVSGVPSEPNRSYVIDIDGCPRTRAIYAPIADRLALGRDNRANVEEVRRLFEGFIAENASCADAPERATFTIGTADGGSLVLLLQARSKSPTWRAEVEERLQIVAPLLAELAGAERTKLRASRRLSLLESALDEMSVAMFMLDAQARPFCLNAAAFARLAMADAFRLKANGVLGCVTPRDTATLHEAVRRTIGAPPSDMYEEPLLIATRDGDRTIATLRSVSADGRGRDNRAALLMIQHEVRLSRAALDALGLTASEQRFLSTFLYCSSLTSAAERLNLSDETARTYLKRISAKLGVRKQAELVALIWNLSLPLRRKPDTTVSRAPGALGRLSSLQSSMK